MKIALFFLELAFCILASASGHGSVQVCHISVRDDSALSESKNAVKNVVAASKFKRLTLSAYF
jgi:thermostable 8-oxoguanine DNA glycosylase